MDENRPALLTVKKRPFIVLHTRFPSSLLFLRQILTVPTLNQLLEPINGLLWRASCTQVAQSLVYQCASGPMIGSFDIERIQELFVDSPWNGDCRRIILIIPGNY